MTKSASLELILPNVYRYLREVHAYFPIIKAYVFGSYASNKATVDSDIDLVIVSSAFSGSRFEDNVAVSKLIWGIDTRIEPITFRPEQFDYENMLASEILTNGIELDLKKIPEATIDATM